ncbi:Predicted ATPase [Butyrivibrio sp. INlla18]|uniref:AAA family ATPase n=1 Tax=Butyrivibrio sp. INlla18 TaxID=1520806 RepID=UPI00088F80CE|nr:AAA family ATPase [Butyrivibrio sp. INlla18]SDA73117.1 Predicted ATPase [Butyrivibrio sp. INlla18]
MINELEIKNFKCFEDAKFVFKKLNVLTGPNSSGKSTVIQALLSDKQAKKYGETYFLNGKYIKLGQLSDVKNCYTRGDVCIDATSDGAEVEDRIVYLSTERKGPDIDYKQNLEDETEIGVHGEYAFDFLSRMRLEKIREDAFIYDKNMGVNLGNQVDYWLSYLCGYTITAERIEGTTTVKVSYRTEDNIKDFKAIHVGTGVTYLATIIIAALSCTKKDMLIIENPELYLHPAAQSRFVEFFVFMASKGLQILIETHSDHIFNGIRKSLKTSKIYPQDIAVFFLKKEDGISYPIIINFTKEGIVLNQEKGLFDQYDDDLDVLLGFEYE